MNNNHNETQVKNEITINVTDHVASDYNITNAIKNLQEPHWIFFVYFVLLACGCIMNLIHALTLIRSRRNGVLSLVLQICLVDIASLYVAVNEVFTLNQRTWFFSTELCPFFKGTEVLVNCLIIYLTTCFNFHVISLWNLHDVEVKRNRKNPLTSCNKDDSNECLVTKSENSNRLVTIDYRKRKDDISIVFPTIFVWVVSLSLSVPCFTLSSTLKLKENYTLCAIIDIYYGQILQHSLLIFKNVLPMFLLFLSLIILVVKLSQTSTKDIDSIPTKKIGEIRQFLIFAIALTIVYLLTSFQRQLLHFIHVISYSFKKNNLNNFKMPPLFNNYLNNSTIVYLAMLHYSSSVFRSLLCYLLLPNFQHLIKTKIFVCCKIKKINN